MRGAPLPDLLGLAVVAAAGVPIFAVIATALGVFASDPLAQIVQRRLRPSYMYLYMLLAALYVYALFASTVWQRAGLMVLTALARPRPVAEGARPPALPARPDGVAALARLAVGRPGRGACCSSSCRGWWALSIGFNGYKLTGSTLLIGFAIAGATTFLLMRFVFWRLKSAGVPAPSGPAACGRSPGAQARGW